MDMNLIALKVDPGNAVATLEQTTTRLRATETQSQQTQAAFSAMSGAFKSMAQAMAQEQTALARIPLNNLAQGFGQLGEMMARCQAVSDRLARANDPLAQGFARVAQQMQREQDVLMSIRQPQMEYFDTLTALDKLLERNAISTQEYAQQVTKLNGAIGETPKPQAGPSLGGSLGTLGQVALGGGAAAGVLAAGQKIEDIANEYDQLDDKYTDLYNHALKFADGGTSVNGVLAQQEQLAKNLHSSLGGAMDVYDAVQDATVDLGLSQRQLVAATQAVGEEAVISGKSMASAGDVLNRLILAMDSGADSGRALKTALVGYDAISDTLTKHFGTTRAGLVELGNQQKITSHDIVDALIQESGTIQTEFDKRKLTHEQEKQIIDEKIALYRKDTDEMSATFEATNPKLREMDLQLRALRGDLDDDTKATHFLTNEVRDFGKQLEDLKNKAGLAVTNGTAGFVAGILDVTKGVAGAVENYDVLAKKLGIVDPWKVATDATKQHTEALSDEDKMLQRLHGAYDQAYKDLATVEVLYAKGKISLGEYNDELARNRDILGEPVKSASGGLGSIAPANLNELPTNKTGEIAAKQQAEAYQDALKKAGLAYDEFEGKARDAVSGLDSGWKQIVLDATDSGKHIRDAMTGAFSAIEDSIASMVMKGKFDLSDLGSALEQILVKLAVQQATGGLIGLIGGGMTGFDYMTPGSSGRYAFPGFATGGDMLVGGAGAPDSKLAMFRVSPGESIHVRTPQQREAAGAMAASGPSHTILNLNYDPRAIRSGKDIETGVMNVIRKNPAAIRALLGG